MLTNFLTILLSCAFAIPPTSVSGQKVINGNPGVVKFNSSGVMQSPANSDDLPQGATNKYCSPGCAGVGPIGLQGPAGVKGDKGDTGSAGTNGTNGAVGATGAVGAKGDKGDTGNAGTNGTNGTNGAAGTVGSVGPSGVSGAKGDKGDTGPTGGIGPTGVSGANGIQNLTASTPTRALNTNFTPSTTKSTYVNYTYSISCAATLVGGQTGGIELRSDTNATPTTVRSSIGNANSVSLAIAITVTNVQISSVQYLVPKNHVVRIVSSGTCTITSVAQSEVAFDP